MTLSDVDLALRTLALRPTALTAVVGTRVFVGSDLPAGYDVRPVAGNAVFTGPAVLFSGRGGRVGRTSVLLEATYLVRCYGITQAAARELDTLLLACLHDTSGGAIRVLRCNVTGQHTPESDTGWHTYLSTWDVTAVLHV